MPVVAIGPPHPGYRALRRGRTAIGGQVYLLSFTTWRRAPLFERFVPACAAARALARACATMRSRVLAWVLMPDHVHLLLELHPRETPALAVARIKAAVSRCLARAHPWRQRCWSPGFHDHALRNDEAAVRVARYVVLNPVRAGLVARAGDYPFWDCVYLDSRG